MDPPMLPLLLETQWKTWAGRGCYLHLILSLKTPSTVTQPTEAAVLTEKGTEQPHSVNCLFSSMNELNLALRSLGLRRRYGY